MTVGQRDFVAELARSPLLFRETFRDRASVERNGATLVGTGTTFSDGLVLNGSGNLLYNVSGSKLFRSTLTITIEFTLGFAGDDGALHYFFDVTGAAEAGRYSVTKDASNNIVVTCGGTTVLTVAYATWNAALVVGKNVLVISTTTGATTAWLNGTSIGTSATAWTETRTTTFTIGATTTAASRFAGTIHRLEIYGATVAANSEEDLRQGDSIAEIDLDRSLVWLPGKSYYKRASDSKFVTEVRGKAGITEALMGSDGLTTTQFPSIIRPRGFSFDGGDQINLGDSDQFSFTTGSADLPFSIAFIFRVTTVANAILVAKSTAYASVGEFTIYAGFNASGKYALSVVLVDQTAVAYLLRYNANYPLVVGKEYVGVVTYSGGGLSGIATYIDAARHDANSITSGVYVCMRNTTAPLIIGGAVTGIAALNGQVKMVPVFDFEFSPMQVRQLTARLRRLARAA